MILGTAIVLAMQAGGVELPASPLSDGGPSEWHLLRTDTDGNRYYVDLESIRATTIGERPAVEAITRTHVGADDPESLVGSTHFHYVVDCENEEETVLIWHSYREDDEVWTVDDRDNPIWTKVRPDRGPGATFDFLCEAIERS